MLGLLFSEVPSMTALAHGALLDYYTVVHACSPQPHSRRDLREPAPPGGHSLAAAAFLFAAGQDGPASLSRTASKGCMRVLLCT